MLTKVPIRHRRECSTPTVVGGSPQSSSIRLVLDERAYGDRRGHAVHPPSPSGLRLAAVQPAAAVREPEFRGDFGVDEGFADLGDLPS